MDKRLSHPSPKDIRDSPENIRDSPETIRGNSRDIRDGHKDTSDGLKNIHDSPEDIRDGLKNIRDSPRKSGWKPSRPPSRSQRCSNGHHQKNHHYSHSLHYYIYKGSHFIVHCSPLCRTYYPLRSSVSHSHSHAASHQSNFVIRNTSIKLRNNHFKP